MSIFSYHLSDISISKFINISFNPPTKKTVPGLIHAECLTFMTLGSPVFSHERMHFRKISVFAQWENESALDNFLRDDSFGKILSKGWHTRLDFLRQWGNFSGFDIPSKSIEIGDISSPVVAVTIARMKLFQVPRFINWGRPVEKLVRDHPGKTLALASIRLPRTVSTFSIWKSQTEMIEMVRGHSPVQKPKRHIDAMKERERKDFHFEFTTLRFKPISEHGIWNGQSNFIPKIKE